MNVTTNPSIAPGPTPPTILVVDDEAPVRQLVERVLQRAGYKTVSVASGVEALEAAARMPTLDLLVTDMMMPEMTGDELARRLRRDHESLKVLYFTGFSDRLFEEKRTMWEDEAFLEKPCSAKGIVEAVALLRNENRCIGTVSFDAAPESN